MKFKFITVAAVSVVIFSCMISLSAFAQGDVKGEINWVEGYIHAVGVGASAKGNLAQARPLARRAAVADAQRNLLEITKGVKIDSRTTVENFMVSEDIIKSHVEGVVKGARIVKESYEKHPDGSMGATVEMSICISNCKPGSRPLVQSLNLDKAKDPPYLPPQRYVPPDTPAPAKAPRGKVVTYDTSKPVTGVVFNLEGRLFERVILPVVITQGTDKNLMTVYSAKVVQPNVIRTHGVVRYADSVDQGTKQAHMGNNVMIILVEDITKENMLIIPPEGAKALHETTRHGNDYLGNAKVVIAAQ